MNALLMYLLIYVIPVSADYRVGERPVYQETRGCE